MLDIQLSKNYKITSDSNNYLLNERHTPGVAKNPKIAAKQKKSDEPIWKPVGYFSSLEGLLKSYLQHEIKNSNCKSIEELRNFVLEIKRSIETKLSVLK